MRLQKFIADCGVTSRRKAEELITAGRIGVNGRTVTVLGTKVCPREDVVFLDGRPLDIGSVSKLYVLLNKPRGYMTTVSDPEGRPTVMDLVADVGERIYPVGRLDYLSEGLLLLTNDGYFADALMHPRREVVKVYEVKVFGTVNAGLLAKLRQGALLDGYRAVPKSVRVLGMLPRKTWLEFKLIEGRNRELRKICEHHGLAVDKLRRTAVGAVSIEGHRPGAYRLLSKREAWRCLSGEYRSSKKTLRLKRKAIRRQPAFS